MTQPPVKVGMLGCGVVGGATARILLEHAGELEERAGVTIELVKVAVRSLAKERGVTLPDGVWTTDLSEVVNDPEIDVVVELIGGIEPARDLILTAIRNGKHIVTANKELLANLGEEVMRAAEEAGVDVLFEAAVGGGIPIIRPMKESLAGDRVRRVLGIVNGTTNFILTRMSETGVSFTDALAEADSLGYTEMDPSADIEGYDAASKLAILASLAFDARVVAGDVHREGISKVSQEDIASAHDLGYEVKLLAVAEVDEGEVSVRVHPAMVPRTHPLASVRDVFNAVFVEAEQTGELMFLGRGAGGGPTGSAVVGDLVEIARNIRAGARGIGSAHYREAAHIRPQDETPVRYYVLLSVADQPGVLAGVASVFARHGVSIASVRQEGSDDEATLMLITHTATEGAHEATFNDLQALEVVREIESRMRVEGAHEG
jgi:homoserine dehydrogenase